MEVEMTQIDEPNLDKIDQEITDILLEHLVLANDNGQPYIQYTDVAVDKIITLIATQVREARIDELIWSTGVTYKYDKDRQIVQDRIAELKAQQEEV